MPRIHQLKPPEKVIIHRLDIERKEECDISVWEEHENGRLEGLSVRRIKGPCVIEIVTRKR